jgi:hypothetical protein
VQLPFKLELPKMKRSHRAREDENDKKHIGYRVVSNRLVLCLGGRKAKHFKFSVFK